jgi:hypothetical protein
MTKAVMAVPGWLTCKQRISTMMKSLSIAARLALVAGALAIGSLSASAEPFDGKKFFERLAADGASMPKDFDAKKFFDKLAAEGSSNTMMPPMVSMKK